MTFDETFTLFKEIVKLYPNADQFKRASLDQIDSWAESLKDIPYERAIEELKRHAASSKYAPTVSDFLHKGKYNRAVDGYKQSFISDEDFEKLVVLDMDGWHNGGQYHNGGIGDE